MRRRERKPDAAGLVPGELADREHPLWRDHGAYVAFMAERGWPRTTLERMGADPGPAHRRRAAVEGWARQQGIVSAEHPGFLDWRRLRGMELL